ncbi:MAG: hypothetical protein AVDCRST_MAG66-4373 [uncultured Pseudonocardia sp.]|uniref:Uncharacterized protein n=1 Tax=uncultured Pseudonocardia sp. TaxID=211455 RepID=A0A6J4QHN5_9PSEU|nr:MAG: hypothetical protein AVDCRST_MAG66-4373 [uncultured Pseudonocardia sp.]
MPGARPPACSAPVPSGGSPPTPGCCSVRPGWWVAVGGSPREAPAGVGCGDWGEGAHPPRRRSSPGSCSDGDRDDVRCDVAGCGRGGACGAGVGR